MKREKQTAKGKNTETLAEAHRNFNRGDLEACAQMAAEDVTYTDHARGITIRGREQWKEFLQGWKEAFSDARIDDPTYIDAGDTVIALYTGRGTNDGSFGPFPPTGKEVAIRECEVVHFNDEGKITSGESFYDRMTFLSQLGHVEEEPTAKEKEVEV